MFKRLLKKILVSLIIFGITGIIYWATMYPFGYSAIFFIIMYVILSIIKIVLRLLDKNVKNKLIEFLLEISGMLIVGLLFFTMVGIIY